MAKIQRRLSIPVVLSAAVVLLLVLPAIASARGDRGNRDGRTATNQQERQRCDGRSDRHSTDAHSHQQQDRNVRREHAWPARYARYDRQIRHDAHKARKHLRHQAKHEYRAGFYCKPCRNRFGSRTGFQRHLYAAHRVPVLWFPRSIVRHGLGWIFHG